jgi:hypothetical protein
LTPDFPTSCIAFSKAVDLATKKNTAFKDGRFDALIICFEQEETHAATEEHILGNAETSTINRAVSIFVEVSVLQEVDEGSRRIRQAVLSVYSLRVPEAWRT